MQRLQPAPPASREEATPLASVPDLEPGPLRERLKALRFSDVTAHEVDAFLSGLQAASLTGEPPRERADVLLEVLDEERLCELTGSTGERVGLAALETLLRLGYPYALEATPEMLARARGPEPFRLSARSLVGLGLTGVNVLGPVVVLSEDFVRFLEHLLHLGPEHGRQSVFSDLVGHLPLLVLVLLVPPVLSAVTEWKQSRLGQLFFTGVQAMVGLALVLMALSGTPGDYWMNDTERLLLAACGVLAGVIAFCLSPGESPPEP